MNYMSKQAGKASRGISILKSYPSVRTIVSKTWGRESQGANHWGRGGWEQGRVMEVWGGREEYREGKEGHEGETPRSAHAGRSSLEGGIVEQLARNLEATGGTLENFWTS